MGEKFNYFYKMWNLPHKGFNLKQNFSLENLNKDLQNSLSRLNTNYIDYYLLHSPDLKK